MMHALAKLLQLFNFMNYLNTLIWNFQKWLVQTSKLKNKHTQGSPQSSIKYFLWDKIFTKLALQNISWLDKFFHSKLILGSKQVEISQLLSTTDAQKLRPYSSYAVYSWTHSLPTRGSVTKTSELACARPGKDGSKLNCERATSQSLVTVFIGWTMQQWHVPQTRLATCKNLSHTNLSVHEFFTEPSRSWKTHCTLVKNTSYGDILHVYIYIYM